MNLLFSSLTQKHASHLETLAEEIWDSIYRRRHAGQGAGREPGVVLPVAGGGAGVHDEVAVAPPGTAVPPLGVVRRAQVVPDLVGQSDLRHLMGAI